jgi:hypothetical protein
MYIEDSPYQRDQLINIDQVIGRAMDRGVDLGEDHRQTIEKYVSLNLIPRLLNGDFPATVVDRLVSIDKLVKEGKSLEQIQQIIKEERRKFLKQPLDLPSLVDTYKKASKSLLMLSALAIVIYLGAVGLSSSSNPIATEVVGKPVGNVLAAFIRQAKDDNANSTDPLGITNISEIIKVNEKKEVIIEKQIIQIGEGEKIAINLDADKVDGADAGVSAGNVLLLDQFGDINITGNITIGGIFTGDGSGLTNLPIPSNILNSGETYENPAWLNGLEWSKITGRPNLLTSLDGVVSNLGDIDFVAGAGVTITPNDTNNTITFNLAGSGVNADLFDSIDSGQFLRSDTSDNFTSGTLTFNAGTTLDVDGTATFVSLTASGGTTGISASGSSTAINVPTGTFATGVQVGDWYGGTITTGYRYFLKGLQLYLISAAGTDGYLVDVDCEFCTTRTTTLTNGFHVKSSNAQTTVTNGINIEALTGGSITNAINISGAAGITTDIILQNAETIDNNTNGTIALGGDLDVSGHGALGSGSSVVTSQVLRLNESSSTELVFYGLTSSVNSSYNSTGSPFVFGGSIDATYSGADTGTQINGLSVNATHSGSGTATYLDGLIVNTVTGVGSGAVTFGRGLVIRNIFSGAAPSFAYGLHIESFTAGTTRYPIYQEGASGTNVFVAPSSVFGRTPGGNDTSYGLVVQGALCVDDSTSNCPSSPTSGAIYVENSVGTGNVSAFDLSEYYPASEDVQKGDVVVADPNLIATVRRSNDSYQPNIIGVVATDPAIVINENEIAFGKTAGDNFNSRKPYIALAGRVPVKVSTENGPISVGDPLTSSSITGVAMKATQSGPVIGKALENYSGNEVSKILVFVSTSWYAKPIASNQSNQTIDLQSSSVRLESIFLGNNQIKLGSNGDIVFEGSVSISGDLGISGTLFAERVVTDQLQVSKLNLNSSSDSSGSALLPSGQTKVTVKTKSVTDNSKVLVTPTSLTDNQVLVVTRKVSATDFEVSIQSSVSSDITFDWWVVN